MVNEGLKKHRLLRQKETSTVSLGTVLLVCILVLGCRPTSPDHSDSHDQPTEISGNSTSGDSSVDDEPKKQQSIGVTRLERIPGSNVTTDIDEGTWTSEAFSTAAQTQLDVIASWFKDRNKVSLGDLYEIITSDFQSTRLRPAEMEIVFQDDGFEVSRPRGSSDKLNRMPFAGRHGWTRALEQLARPFHETSNVHCKFKVFRVNIADADVTTAVVFHLGGRTSNQAIECSAQWECKWTKSSGQQQPRLKSISVRDFEQVMYTGTSGSLFSDCTESVLGANESFHHQLVFGLDHWLRRLELYHGVIATSYHGLAVGDVNGDGLDDVYVCQPGGISGGLPNRLFVQQPDGTARDVSGEAAVDWLIETHSALLIDLDNDADQDLVAATMAGLIIAENNGAGTFRPRTFKLIPDGPPISLAAADFDDDGDLDIYSCCYARRASSTLMARPIPYHDANNGSRNVLLRNDRDWRFTNVTKQVGLDQFNRRFSLACAWEDFDNDGDQDLYVANDFGRNNLYRNDGGHFTDVAKQLGVEDMSAGMSVSWGDCNNDGCMDLYVSNMWSSAGNRIAYQRQFLHAGADALIRGGFQRHARGNSMFANLGRDRSYRFSDVSVNARVTMGGWAWSSNYVDINNDGWQDLIVANGYITQESSQDL